MAGMAIRAFEGRHPEIHPSAYVDESAVVIGRVTIGADASLWPAVVVRGDIHDIRIGARTNIQDGSVLHVTHDSGFAPGGYALTVGADVTVGHRVVLHACRIEDHCLIGMGAVVMDGAHLHTRVMLAAGSLVPPGKHLEGGYLWLGSPARRARRLTEAELKYLDYSAAYYVQLKNRHASGRAL
jgi:carbonic anhydrase/acetyltransferase-like protein (isoleucine patch superfamily)